MPIFDTPLRTIKRWVALGRAHQDPPPLDQPELMADWYPRHHRNRAPSKLLRFKKTEKKSAARDASINTDSGGDAGVRLALHNLIDAQQRLERAKLSEDENAITRASRNLQTFMELYYAAQRLANDTDKLRGEFAPKSEIFASDSILMEQLHTIHDSLWQKIDNRLADVDLTLREKIHVIVSSEIDNMHALIRQLPAQFSDNDPPLELQSA